MNRGLSAIPVMLKSPLWGVGGLSFWGDRDCSLKPAGNFAAFFLLSPTFSISCHFFCRHPPHPKTAISGKKRQETAILNRSKWAWSKDYTPIPYFVCNNVQWFFSLLTGIARTKDEARPNGASGRAISMEAEIYTPNPCFVCNNVQWFFSLLTGIARTKDEARPNGASGRANSKRYNQKNAVHSQPQSNCVIFNSTLLFNCLPAGLSLPFGFWLAAAGIVLP